MRARLPPADIVTGRRDTTGQQDVRDVALRKSEQIEGRKWHLLAVGEDLKKGGMMRTEARGQEVGGNEARRCRLLCGP